MVEAYRKPRKAAPFWVDTDIALGSHTGDVDDGFALALILRAAGSMQGVSVVDGNTSAAVARVCAQRLVAAAEVDPAPEVSPLASTAARLAEFRGTLLAIGPPTNLIAAAANSAEFAPQTDVFCVGTVLQPLKNPQYLLYDLNLNKRPRRARRFFALPWRSVTIYPLDVVRRLEFGSDALSRIGETSPLGAYLQCHALRWLARTRARYGRSKFPVWDLVAALGAIEQLPGARYVERNGRRVLADFAPDAALQTFIKSL